MQDAELLPPIRYGTMWFVVGLGMLCAIIFGIGFILWITRNKKMITVADLSPKELKPQDINQLKKKYLVLLDQIEQGYVQKKYSARSVHQFCSRTLRMFVYEASGFRAQVMTLNDLKLSRYPDLGKIIAEYYPPEFASAESTSIDDAVSLARKAIESWV